MSLYTDMTPEQQAEIDRQEDEREARKAGYDYGDAILGEDWDPADFVFVTPASIEDMVALMTDEERAEFEAFLSPPLTDEDMDQMAREHEEEMMARAEMESAALLKFTGGEWS